jgi:hypothetical protein
MSKQLTVIQGGSDRLDDGGVEEVGEKRLRDLVAEEQLAGWLERHEGKGQGDRPRRDERALAQALADDDDIDLLPSRAERNEVLAEEDVDAALERWAENNLLEDEGEAGDVARAEPQGPVAQAMRALAEDPVAQQLCAAAATAFQGMIAWQQRVQTLAASADAAFPEVASGEITAVAMTETDPIGYMQLTELRREYTAATDAYRQAFAYAEQACRAWTNHWALYQDQIITQRNGKISKADFEGIAQIFADSGLSFQQGMQLLADNAWIPLLRADVWSVLVDAARYNRVPPEDGDHGVWTLLQLVYKMLPGELRVLLNMAPEPMLPSRSQAMQQALLDAARYRRRRRRR